MVKGSANSLCDVLYNSVLSGLEGHCRSGGGETLPHSSRPFARLFDIGEVSELTHKEIGFELTISNVNEPIRL